MKTKSPTITEEVLTCGACKGKGSLEFWGVSSDYRLFRCASCGVIHQMEWGMPLYTPCRGSDLRCGDGWLSGK